MHVGSVVQKFSTPSITLPFSVVFVKENATLSSTRYFDDHILYRSLYITELWKTY